jgi:hypothetical protein
MDDGIAGVCLNGKEDARPRRIATAACYPQGSTEFLCIEGRTRRRDRP